MITDQKIIFSEKKWQAHQRYDKITQVKIECDEYPRAFVNKNTDAWLANAGASRYLLGATIALVLRFAIEQKNDGEKIILSAVAGD